MAEENSIRKEIKLKIKEEFVNKEPNDGSIDGTVRSLLYIKSAYIRTDELQGFWHYYIAKDKGEVTLKFISIDDFIRKIKDTLDLTDLDKLSESFSEIALVESENQ